MCVTSNKRLYKNSKTLLMTREDFLRLYEKFLKDECTKEEEALLFSYEDDFEFELKPWDDLVMGEKEEVRMKILAGLNIQAVKKKIFWPAFAIVLLIGIGGYILYPTKEKTQEVVAEKIVERTFEEILPGSDKAVLILGDGSKVNLDSAKKKFVLDQPTVKTYYDNGELKYEAINSEAIVYNAIATPRGGQYKLKLSDGTQVWLNADSYLRFPTVFTGEQRVVELKGEGYFEVKHNPENPFIVKLLNTHIPGTEIQVKGTSFNVNAYDNENYQAITLVEGKLTIQSAKESNDLKPGEIINVSDKIKISKANIEPIIAWRENRFQFENESLESILKKIERWYDVDVVYNNIPKENFYGIISRDVPLSQVIKMLELSSKQKFEIKSNQLLVK